jgi:hypothetical protein
LSTPRAGSVSGAGLTIADTDATSVSTALALSGFSETEMVVTLGTTPSLPSAAGATGTAAVVRSESLLLLRCRLPAAIPPALDAEDPEGDGVAESSATTAVALNTGAVPLTPVAPCCVPCTLPTATPTLSPVTDGALRSSSEEAPPLAATLSPTSTWESLLGGVVTSEPPAWMDTTGVAGAVVAAAAAAAEAVGDPFTASDGAVAAVDDVAGLEVSAAAPLCSSASASSVTAATVTAGGSTRSSFVGAGVADTS